SVKAKLEPLSVKPDKWIKTPFMAAKLNSTTTYIRFKDRDGMPYWIKSEIMGAKKGKMSGQGLNKKLLKWTDVTGEGIDIEQKVYDNRIKESIILNKARKTPILFKISYNDRLKIVKENNTLVFKNKHNMTLVEIEKPYGIDADGNKYQFKYELVGKKMLKLVPDGNITPAKYPFVIDPSFLIHKTNTSLATKSDRGLARTSNGYLHAVYVREVDGYDRPCYARSTDNGNTWTEEYVFSANTNGYSPSIGVDSENNLHVVWDDDSGLMYAKYSGTAWTEPIKLADVIEDIDNPALAIDGNDNIHVVWNDYNGTSNYYQIRYIKYNGSSWSSVMNLTNSNYNSVDPSIAIDYNNHIHVVWSEEDSSNISQIYYRRSTTSGESWGSIEQITSESDDQSQPAIAVDTNNNLHVVFTSFWLDNGQIRYVKYDGSWSGITNLSEYATGFSSPTISISLQNVIDVVWYGTNMRHNQYTTSWSGDNGLGITGENPSLIMAVHPIKCNIRPNIPYTGFAFIYTDNTTVRYYEDSNLSWLTSNKYDLTVKAMDSETSTYINNFTAELSTGESDSTTDGTITFSCIDGDQWITITVTAEGYHVNSKDTYLSSDKTETILLEPISGSATYNLTIRAKDLETGVSINNFTAELSTGESNSTVNGSITFTSVSGNQWISVTITASGYYVGYKDVYLDGDKEITILLTSTEKEKDYYARPTHLVEFRVQNLFGHPISDINVTAVGIETTMGSWSWLYNLFGYRNETEIQNSTMSGVTDSNGAITFFMVPTIQYKITFIKDNEINKTIYIYPKDERYTIVLGLGEISTSYENISINFSTSEVNSTHRFFNVSYQDLTIHTNHLGFYIYVKSLNSTGNVTELYNETLTGVNTYNFSYLASGWKGKVFYVKCNATYNDSYFEPVEQTKGYMYYLKQRLIDLGFDEAHEWYYNAIAVALLVLIAAMFSGITVKYGAVITPGAALGLWWIGWLSVPHAAIILPTAFVIGVLYYMSESAKEEGMT
ncbi:MAG: hypothetical protein DRP18_03320, partial [Candidatus Aenigmatarchaeota archaeon]